MKQYLEVISVSNDDKCTPTGQTAKIMVSTAKQMFDANMVEEAMKSGILYLKEDTYNSVATSLIPSKTGVTYVYHKDRELLTVYSKDGITEFCGDYDIAVKDFNTLVEIANTVKSCESMFSGCESFDRQVYIPESVENCRLMFNDCHSLNSAIIIGNGVTNCSSMFWGCTAFNKEVIIPNSVKNCDSMFHACLALNQPITIGNSVEVCDDMFYACKSFNQHVEIPDSVTHRHNMFEGCPLMDKSTGGSYTLYSLQRDVDALMKVLEKHPYDYAKWFHENFPNGASSKDEVLSRLKEV